MPKISFCPVCGCRMHRPHSVTTLLNGNKDEYTFEVYVCYCDAVFSTGRVVWGHRLSSNLGLPSYYYGQAEIDKVYWGHIDRSKCPDGRAVTERIICRLEKQAQPSRKGNKL